MKIADTSTPVVILKLFSHGGLGAIRSLGRLGIPVYCIDADPHNTALRSRYCVEKFIWDVEQAPPEESVHFLQEVSRKIGRHPVLIPNGDAPALFAADCADALEGSFRFRIPSGVLSRALSDKRGMYFLAKKHGVPTAETAFPRCRRDVVQFLEGDQATFPIMLKGQNSWLLQQRTGLRMIVVRDAKELLEKYDDLEDPANPNLMLQEYIPGGDDSVWMFNGYFDERSECLLGFTGRKLRQYPVYTGMTSLGICLKNEIVEQTTKAFMKAVGYTGILDIGYRYDARDDQFKLLDVNPRVGATFRLFVGTNGLDVVRALYLDVTHQPVPPSLPREGRKWLVENNDLISFRHYRMDGKLTFWEWIRSFRGVEETAWFAWDDWAPFLLTAREVGAHFFRWACKAQGSPRGIGTN